MNRLDEILKKLNTKHCNVEPQTEEEYEEIRCKWANDNSGNLNEKDGYNCDICKNKGVVYFLKKSPYTNQNEMTLKNCDCMKIRNTLKRAKESGLNNILSDYTFAKYETNSDWQIGVKETALNFCKDNDANWFYIGGQSGAGKTHICTAIAGHYIKQGKDCRYMLWRDDAVKLKQLVNDYTEYQQVIQDFKQANVLYIDDLFKSQNGAEPTKADINLAFELLNNRLMDKDKITIISSEFMITEALEFDEATIGRVFQKAGKYKLSIPKDRTKNYRLKG